MWGPEFGASLVSGLFIALAVVFGVGAALGALLVWIL